MARTGTAVFLVGLLMVSGCLESVNGGPDIPIREIPSEYAYQLGPYGWLDNERLLVPAYVGPPWGTKNIVHIVWDGGSSVREFLGGERVRFLCAGNRNIYVRHDLKKISKTQVLVDFAYGNEKTFAKRSVQFDHLPHFRSSFRADLNHGFTTYRGPLVQSRFDCKLVDTGPLAKRYGVRNLAVLSATDGFLGFKREQNGLRSVVFHRKKDDPGVSLTMPPGRFQEHCVVDAPFIGAYFIYQCAWGRRSREKWKKFTEGRHCFPYWWFYPESRQIVRECVPFDRVYREPAIHLPTKAGIVRITRSSGIFLLSEEGDTTMLFSGYAMKPTVSPDGCRVAFVYTGENSKEYREKKSIHRMFSVCDD